MGTYKTNWQLTETVMPEDMNRIEGNIKGNNTELVKLKENLREGFEERDKEISKKAAKEDVILKVPIPEDSDCNSFKDLNSFCVFDTGAGAFKNTPEGTLDIGTSRVFMLINKGYNQGRFQQEFINLYPQDRITRYIRNFNADGNGIWGNWYKVYDEANKPTPNDIGTYAKQEIDNKDTSTLNSAKSYTNENFLTKAPTRLDKKDLNTITDPGRYVCANCTNAPTTYGRMDVLVWNDYKSVKWITQIFYSDVSNKVFTRCSTKVDATTWTSWAIMYSSMNKPTPADIGASPSNHNHDSAYLGKTATATNSNKLFGYGKYTGQNQGGAFGIPVVGSDGVMETGYIIDMNLPNSEKDYDARLQLNGDGSRLAFNNHVIYTDGNKPTPEEIRAFGGYGFYNVGVDLNILTENGAYEITEISHCLNGITDNVYNWGTLVVFNCNKVNGTGQRITQIYYPHVAQNGKRIPYMRVRDGGKWTPWSKVTEGLTASDVGARPSNWNPTWNDVQDKPSSFPPSSHNHDDRYLKKEVGATNESFRFRTKFLEFGVDDGKLGEIGVGPNDTYLHNTKSDKYFALKDNGELLYDGKKVLRDIQGSPLWQGFHHMAGKETVTPSKPLSQCNNGWVLVWSDWDDGVGTQDWNFCFTYIPKNTPWKNGKNHTFPLSAGEDTWAIKTLYVYDTYFRGNDTNKNGGNYDVILRAVLEY
ncbi:pyocin knob domain-containing protein [Clostridium baratii]|uniref:pyocin knob domain-containing protein n=1 Tax=Clostridium baratii TaxID=1561 RepID=UPI0006BA818B|nr:pyocin knob domain-containing protein [Clostridium baratii]